MMTSLFEIYTQLVGSLSTALDACLGTGVLGQLISTMGLPSFAALVLFGSVMSD
jgi:hypothetical protein